MFQYLSRLSNSSPWLCLVYGVVLPFLGTLCLLSIMCTTLPTMSTRMTAAMDENLKAQHLLQRPVRDINDDDDDYDDNSTNNETELYSVDQQQMDQKDKAEGLSIGTFLGNLSSTARAQLYNIVNSPNMTKKEITDALDAWAQTQGQPFYTIYLGLKAAYEAARQQLDQQHTEMMQNQSQAAREADTKMQTISNNQFITFAEEKRQMAEQLAKFPADVQQILLQFAPYPYNKK